MSLLKKLMSKADNLEQSYNDTTKTADNYKTDYMRNSQMKDVKQQGSYSSSLQGKGKICAALAMLVSSLVVSGSNVELELAGAAVDEDDDSAVELVATSDGQCLARVVENKMSYAVEDDDYPDYTIYSTDNGFVIQQSSVNGGIRESKILAPMGIHVGDVMSQFTPKGFSIKDVMAQYTPKGISVNDVLAQVIPYGYSIESVLSQDVLNQEMAITADIKDNKANVLTTSSKVEGMLKGILSDKGLTPTKASVSKGTTATPTVTEKSNNKGSKGLVAAEVPSDKKPITFTPKKSTEKEKKEKKEAVATPTMKPTAKPTEAPKETAKPTEAPKTTAKPTEAPKVTEAPKATETLKVSEATTPAKAGTVEDGRKYAQENGYTHKIYEYEVTKPEQYEKKACDLAKAEWGDMAMDYEYTPDEIYAEIWSTDSVDELSDSSRFVVIYHGVGSTESGGLGFTNPMNNGDSIKNDMREFKAKDIYDELKLKYSDTQDFFKYLDTSKLDVIYVSEGLDNVLFNYEIRNPEMKFILHSDFKTLPEIHLSDSFTEFEVPEGIEASLGIDGTFVEKIVYPEGIQYISGPCGMYFLEKINLPDSVEVIGGFINCPKLKQVDLPKNLKRIEGGSFAVRPVDILNNTRYKSDERLKEVYKLFDCDGKEKSKHITDWSDIRLPEGIEYVGVSCFSRYNDVTYYISKKTDTKNWSPEWRDIVDADCNCKKADVIKY